MIGHVSPEPEICTCCARPATPVAAIPNFGASDGFFVCAFCSLNLAFKVIAMKPNQLHDIEHGAIEAAIRINSSALLQAVLECVFNHSVLDLTTVDEEKFQLLCIALSGDKNFSDAVKQLFLAYTHAVRLELTNAK